MKMDQVRKKAQQLGIKLKNRKKDELIHLIQQREDQQRNVDRRDPDDDFDDDRFFRDGYC